MCDWDNCYNFSGKIIQVDIHQCPVLSGRSEILMYGVCSESIMHVS